MAHSSIIASSLPFPPWLPQTSNTLAKVEGPYSTYEGSPMSKGILQFDMWGVKPSGESTSGWAG